MNKKQVLPTHYLFYFFLFISFPSLFISNIRVYIIVALRNLKNIFRMVASKSWLEIPADSHFSIANIPFGIISTESQEQKRPAVAIGDYALDLQTFSKKGGFSGLPSIQDKLSVFEQPTLNAFAALGRPVHRQVREYLQDVLSEGTSSAQVLKDNEELKKEALIPRDQVKLHLPMQIGDYTDFFAGINHAFNVRELAYMKENNLIIY